MPEMNGYQVLEVCLQDPELRNIPIIMTSSLDEIDSVVKCIELGAEGRQRVGAAGGRAGRR